MLRCDVDALKGLPSTASTPPDRDPDISDLPPAVAVPLANLSRLLTTRGCIGLPGGNWRSRGSPRPGVRGSPESRSFASGASSQPAPNGSDKTTNCPPPRQRHADVRRLQQRLVTFSLI